MVKHTYATRVGAVSLANKCLTGINVWMLNACRPPEEWAYILHSYSSTQWTERNHLTSRPLTRIRVLICEMRFVMSKRTGKVDGKSQRNLLALQEIARPSKVWTGRSTLLTTVSIRWHQTWRQTNSLARLITKVFGKTDTRRPAFTFIFIYLMKQAKLVIENTVV